MAKMMVPMSTGQVDPYISEQVTGMQIRSTPAEFPLVLLSTSSISILSSIVAMSMASTRRPPRPRSPLASPPLHLRTAKTTQLPTRGTNGQSNRTAAGSNGLLRAAVAESGRHASIAAGENRTRREGMEEPKGPGPDLKRRPPLPALAGPYGSPSRRPQGC